MLKNEQGRQTVNSHWKPKQTIQDEQKRAKQNPRNRCYLNENAYLPKENHAIQLIHVELTKGAYLYINEGY